MPWNELGLKGTLNNMDLIILVDQAPATLACEKCIHLIVIFGHKDVLFDNTYIDTQNLVDLFLLDTVDRENKASIEGAWLMSNKLYSHLVFKIVIVCIIKYFDLNFLAFEVINVDIVEPFFS